MSITSVDEVLIPKTEAQLIDEALKVLADADPPIGPVALQSGSVLRTLVVADARALEDVHQVVGQLGRSAFMSTAEGPWLDLRAASTFSLTRIAATRATHTIRVTCLAGAGPVTIGPGAMLVTRANGSATWRSTNATNETVPDGGHFDFTVMCETAGLIGNASVGTITTLITPAAAGLSVTHTATGIVARGAETDPELRARAQNRWATQGSGFTRAAVTYWAASAEITPGVSAGATRVSFAPPDGLGGYVVYVAGADGPLDPSQVAAIQADLNLRKPITDSPVVTNSTAATIVVAGNIRFRSASTGAEQLAVAAAIRTYVNGLEMPDDDEITTVDLAGIDAAIYGAVAPGRIVDVDLSSPAADSTVTLGSVAVANTAGLTFS